MDQPQSDNESDCETSKQERKEPVQSGLVEEEFIYMKIYHKHYLLPLLAIVLGIFVTVLISFRECNKCFNDLNNCANLSITTSKPSLKKFWVYGRNVESGYLKNIFVVLERLGYEHDPNSTDWDLLWAHDYPFRSLYSNLRSLQPHQKVNHFPGCGYITNKVDLVTSGLEYVPPAFKLPSDKEKLLSYAEIHNGTSFVQKSNDHRNIQIKKLNEINLNAEGSFIQEFVDKPFLVSGYKFDIGIYTIITSVDPLRVYTYNGDALLRFCPIKYYPFDPSILDKYVVGDDYLPIWQVPALKYYYNELGFGMKESLNAYVKSQGKDPSVIWKQIEDSIRNVCLAKEEQIVNVLNRFPSKHNFFEMMRFDFILDEDLKIYLMEANMSPNLSSGHFPPNQLLYEQVIYNLMSLVGIAERVRKDSLAERSSAEESMLTANKNIVVFPRECNSALCRSSCMSPACQLCIMCISPETKATLVQAHREHMNRGDCKRIFPPPMKRDIESSEIDFESYSLENQLHYRWFLGKCLLDSSWCN